MDACNQCPHPNDCLKVGACLDDLNAPLIASGQFSRLMTPSQANEFMAALRAGRHAPSVLWSRIRISTWSLACQN
jgi:hypothetical protein